VKSRITERLRGTAPAHDVQSEARAPWPPEISAALFPKPLVPAAVLVPLVERDTGLTVLLTRRTDHLRDHPGQISFPGGRLDPGDAGPLEAALRETTEELGIAACIIEVAGYLPPHAVVTGFVVTPIVGFLPATFDLRPDSFEVADVFEVPLDFLLNPVNAIPGRRRVQDLELPVWEYIYERHRIWGATAHILKSFVNLINK
jgi:8-oxo-dGTP pyrophosphatase MutT (NUDIX family)